MDKPIRNSFQHLFQNREYEVDIWNANSDSEIIIIFSHGFGVDKYSKGLFADIATNSRLALGRKFIFFDYFSRKNQHLRFIPNITHMTELLKDIIQTYAQDKKISLICHSLGCSIAEALSPEINQAILIAPPPAPSRHRIQRKLESKGVVINANVDVFLPTSKGETFQIEAGFFEQIRDLDPKLELSKWVESTSTKINILEAANEEIIIDSYDEFKASAISVGVGYERIDGDHNFSDEGDRQILIKKISSILNI